MIMTEKENLQTIIVNANRAYRAGSPLMSDLDYDNLLEQYEKLVTPEEFSIFRNSLNEGEIEFHGKKVNHRFIIGSLNKLKHDEPDDVAKFLSKHISTTLNVSSKIDGLSGVAKYVNGYLVSLSTRGDGYEGCLITEKAQYIKGLKTKIETTEPELYIRGEMVISKKVQVEKNISAARNVVAGLINRLEWNENDIKDISFVAYTILGDKFTKKEQFEFLTNAGFETAWNIDIPVQSDIQDRLFEYAAQDFLWECDGLVISDSTYRNEDKYRPDAQRAFKVNADGTETRLLDVEFEGPSAGGYFIPVGVLEPVEISGVTVTRCTLHNLDFISNKNLKIGDNVKIIRSGEVIPKLLSVTSTFDTSVEIAHPEFCSCCGEKLVRDGINLRCPNKKCEAQVILQLEHFLKRLKVKNCASASLRKFHISGYDSLAAFTADPKYKSEVSLEKELLEKVFTKSKQDLLVAMNFNGLAEKNLMKIFEHFGTEKLLSELQTGNLEAYIMNMPRPEGIGDILLKNFISDFPGAVENLQYIVNNVRYVGTVSMSTTCKKIVGNVCFTGSLSISREKAMEMAEKAGYEVKSGVSKNLTYLVTDDINSGSTKAKKALELGIKVISGEEFLKMVDPTIETELF